MTDSAATLLVLTAAVALVGVLVSLAVFLWYAATLARVFDRRGVDGWRAWVPVLNEAEILRLGGRPAWAVVFFFIPVVNVYAVVLHALAAHRIGRSFGRGGWATVLAVVLPPVWSTVLAATKDPAPETTRPPAPARPGAEPRTAAAHAAPEAATAPALAAPPVAVAPVAVAPVATPQVATPPVATPQVATPPVEVPPVAAAATAAPAPEEAPSAEPPAADAPIAAPQPVPAPISVVPEQVGGPDPSPEHPQSEPSDPAAAADPAPLLEPPAAAEPEAAPVELPASETVRQEPAQPVETFDGPGDIDDIDDPDDIGETVVVHRAPAVAWHLVADDGARYPLHESVVVLGRRPAGEEPGVQYLPVADASRTLSKQHACLTLADGGWTVADLGSTNGVFVENGGVEARVPTDESVPVTGRLVLGTLGLRIERTGTGGGAA
jgi:hypothetical protein